MRNTNFDSGKFFRIYDFMHSYCMKKIFYGNPIKYEKSTGAQSAEQFVGIIRSKYLMTITLYNMYRVAIDIKM